MKAFANANVKTLQEAAAIARDGHRLARTVSFSGGGSDLVTLIKERLVTPDIVVNLRGANESTIAQTPQSLSVGGLVTLDALSRHVIVRAKYAVLAEAAESVATPQIRNVATLGGNVCQRPWCWYFRNGFPCLKNGGTTCFSVTGENQFHAIFGGGPSYIVHPSDTAPALMALDASFRIVGPGAPRLVPAAAFFTLPRPDATKENVLADDEIVAGVIMPAARPNTRSTYHKIMDREAWTHAIVSAAVVFDMNGDTCTRARVVLGGVAPIPWRLPEVEKLLTGERITPELAAQAGEAAIEGARPLEKNKYKVPLTKNLVKRTVLELARGPA
ncbi:MAG TPA: FAD binding domain-containing protein [Vicinamibacterales bacterium]|jgi:xanthine dehydrogenase YagS FAD-binding subunit|nr:FAD binding domain-containing protein [Vicinamibacterales bacterium]